MADQLFQGARAIIWIKDKPVGLFTQCSWGLSYGAVPNHILGASAPVEITYTHQDAISIDMTGFHILEKFVYAKAGMPTLRELLIKEDISVTIVDRQTGKEVMSVTGVKPFRWGTATNARDISTFTVSMLGLRMTTSDNLQDGEGEGAAQFPSDTSKIV